MTTSDSQGERHTFALNAESTAGRAQRTSRTLRNVVAFVAGLTLGFLPLFLFLLNHLTISPPLFLLNPSLTFCNLQTYIRVPHANIGVLDTVVFILYPIEACLGLPTVVVMGKCDLPNVLAASNTIWFKKKLDMLWFFRRPDDAESGSSSVFSPATA